MRHTTRLTWVMASGLAVALLQGCGERSSPASVTTQLTQAQGVWTNGDFESGGIGTAPTGWTVTTYLNPNGVSGTSSVPPTSLSGLNLKSQGSGVYETFLVGDPNGTAIAQADPDLGTGKSLRYPFFGAQAVRVNFKDSYANNGNNKNVNLMQQTMTLTSGDIDPVDGLLHVRFVVAPVLENPSHSYNQQPYFFVQLVNVSRNTTLYSGFNVAGTTGGAIPWQTAASAITGHAVQWLDWQLIDISPATSAMALGDEIQLNVLASGCALGGHFGRIYVDGIGATLPGVYAEATGPSSATANSNITYTVNYANGGTTNAPSTVVNMVMPASTTYVSNSLGSSCTAPSASNGNTLSCSLGTLTAGSNGSFTVTVHINSTATGSIINGNYGISTPIQQTLLGPPVTTTLKTLGTNADIIVTQSITQNPLVTGQSVTITIDVTNNSTTTQLTNSGVPTISDVFPKNLLSSLSWSCATKTAGSGATTHANSATYCGSGNKTSGTGNISFKPQLIGYGGTIELTVTGTVGTAGTYSNTVTVPASSSVSDPNLNNNTATLSIQSGASLNRLTVIKAGTATGSVTSTPAYLSCGTACNSQNANFVTSGSVTLLASPASGATFAGWASNNGNITCSSSSRSCTFTLAQNSNVTATFNTISAGTAKNMYIYDGNSQTAATSTAFSKPISVLVTDANNVAVTSGVNVNFAVNANGDAGATLSANSNTTNALGIASVVVTANPNTGAYSVTASATSLPSVQFALTNVGPAKHLRYLTGGDASEVQSTVVSTAFPTPLMVQLVDNANNGLSGTTVYFAANANNGALATLSAANVTTNTDGLAYVTATANSTVGALTANANISTSDPNIQAVTFYLQNIAASPNYLYVVNGNNQIASTSTAFSTSLQVQVADALGNALANQNVTFSPPTSGAGATLSVTNPTSDANGYVYATATANSTAGSYLVKAALTTNPNISTTFALTNDGGYVLSVQQGTPQTSAVNANYTTSLQINLADSSGNNVPNANITFQAPTTGASVSLSGGSSCGTGCRIVATDTSGLASVTARANSVAGFLDVYASNANAPTNADFSLQNLAGAAAAIVASSGTPQSTAVGTGFALPLVALVEDSSGNAVQNANVVFTAGSGASVTLSAPSALTDVTGLASITATAGNLMGTYLVTATTSGAAASANFLLTNTCGADSDCTTGYWCRSSTCTQQLSNGTAMPAVAGHTPTLDGTCTDTAAAVVCQSGVCDKNDASCGYATGDGHCTSSTANSVCRTQLCSAAGVCLTAGTCRDDADCATGYWCNISTTTCMATLSNGTALPTDPNHASPTLNGACNPNAAKLVCTSKVCDTDNACGYLNGDGTCAAGDPNGVCRAGVCGSDTKCGLANGEGACSSTNAGTVCRSGTCDGSNLCTAPATCTTDSACPSDQWCSFSTGTCKAKFANGSLVPSDPNHAPTVLDGNCTTSAAAVVCVSGVCDTSDNRCGYLNGDGNCTVTDANMRCRTQVCGSDGACGLGLGDSGCTSSSASTVCRSGTCSQDGNCMPVGGCNSDADCTPPQWCLVNTATCMPQLSNGVAIPTDPNHLSPVLDGNCTVAAGALVCQSGVCGPDNACGYANAGGNCTAGNANVVCRSEVCGSDHTCGLHNGDFGCTVADANTTCQSSTCSQDGHCMPVGDCRVDLDCTSPNWCNIQSFTCMQPVANGNTMPTDPNHVSPVLDGNCRSNAAVLVCASQVCDSTDNRCGYANGDGTCTANTAATVCRTQVCSSSGTCGLGIGDTGCTPSNAATVCQSQACSVNGTCMPSQGCNVDGDCPGAWCWIASHTCMPLVDNGNTMPVDTAHASPTLDGNCGVAAATLVCQSGVCDANDNRCGYATGDGNCVVSNANVVCRNGVCGSDGQCGYLNADGNCTVANANTVCRSQACGSDGSCGLSNGDAGCPAGTSSDVCRSGFCSANGTCIVSGSCAVDGDCASHAWCNVALTACQPRLANGQPLPSDPNHVSPSLDGNCTAAAAALVCTSGVCDPNDNACGYAASDGNCRVGNANTVCRSGVCGSDTKCSYPLNEGPCSASNANTVCRSGACSRNFTCMPAGGCNVDTDCPGGWCNIAAGACQNLVDNGGAMPTDPNHTTPTLDGNCYATAASLVCRTGVCDTDNRCGLINGTGPCGTSASVCRSGVCGADQACGYLDGQGACSQGNATLVCRGGACSIHGSVCEPLGGCAVDADCGAAQYCDTVQYACVSKLANGISVPTVTGHQPVLDGNCTQAVGSAVCQSGVCDSDNACGIADGGSCTVAQSDECRSGVCDSNNRCAAVTHCASDTDCNTSTQYCDNGLGYCVAKVPNGSTLPVVAGHTPALDGNCTSGASQIVCQSGVCDTDNRCGYKNLDGPCDPNHAGQLCRSSTCSPSASICIAANGCGVDADCRTDTQWCNTTVQTCVPRLDNGVAIPAVAGHAPALDGTCSAAAGLSVCTSNVCNPNDNRCGFADGDGPCASSDASMKCRSGDCTSGLCVPAGGCSVDSDCLASQYCDTSTLTCAAKQTNGMAMPIVRGHHPALDGTCNAQAAAVVCSSGVCSTTDQACGYPNGVGPCTGGPSPECRSGICASSGAAAGTCVSCSTDSQCGGTLPVCDPNTDACVQCRPNAANACAGATPVCSATLSTCMPCSGDYGVSTSNPCPTTQAPLCILAGNGRGTCSRCASDSDCTGHPDGSNCDTSTGACTSRCLTDAQCGAAHYCSRNGECVPTITNGLPLPLDAGACTKFTGARFCAAGVCDDDGQCGTLNGHGPCSGAGECRSGVCATKDNYCGLPLADGPCSSNAQCRSGACGSHQQCVQTCTTDTTCGPGSFCNGGTCAPTQPDGSACQRPAQCQRGSCVDNTCGAGQFVPAGYGLGRGCASAAPGFLAAAVALVLLRRGSRRARRHACSPPTPSDNKP